MSHVCRPRGVYECSRSGVIVDQRIVAVFYMDEYCDKVCYAYIPQVHAAYGVDGLEKSESILLQCSVTTSEHTTYRVAPTCVYEL